jgi:hypothetical protein
MISTTLKIKVASEVEISEFESRCPALCVAVVDCNCCISLGIAHTIYCNINFLLFPVFFTRDLLPVNEVKSRVISHILFGIININFTSFLETINAFFILGLSCFRWQKLKLIAKLVSKPFAEFKKFSLVFDYHF